MQQIEKEDLIPAISKGQYIFFHGGVLSLIPFLVT